MSSPTVAAESRTVASADGSTIGYEVSGRGPAVVLVAPALADRTDHRRFAALLAQDRTVINYDRRGRGSSSEASPWTVDREVEDLAALIDAHGGSAALFGASSGAVLALDAANSLATRVERVVAFEPPVIVDDGRSPVPRELSHDLDQLVREERRSQALTHFMREALGAPAAMVFALRLMVPAWRQMTAMAHTAAYDVQLCTGLQDGAPIPEDRWTSIDAPVLVLVGEKSKGWAHAGTRAVASATGGCVVTVRRAHHGTPAVRPEAIVTHVSDFLQEG
ncbi:pimeloyl-ACP methyl ester carboxylesterase [Isoptericola sp. CG 20/1183]|uniref:Pimeloyl-ACP methyl ester carboxylesterase n=1 Tax=Isoptericola halotolerans TaxID=300560 RepID=A0ABX5ECF6_9MICO|nr:pimeloyl-ACP methyl ester carboxylesterase [Isoptericola halotolerans]PRZ05920.1 pimeloyl-ACP methyl ester carboxylesterase [Isoptericola sp. CG 20/1183]